VTVQLVHVGDLHFGGVADIRQIEALEAMLPDLRPDAVVIAGDMSQRARHGEFQRARAFAKIAAQTAPVLAIPGNHDVQWWWRPFIPFAKDRLYTKYRSYFGDDLTPTITIPGSAVIASALTAHGVAWGSLTTRIRDIAVKGHLPKSEFLRVQRLFSEAPAGLARVLVVHHNVLRGEISNRMPVALASGAGAYPRVGRGRRVVRARPRGRGRGDGRQGRRLDDRDAVDAFARRPALVLQLRHDRAHRRPYHVLPLGERAGTIPGIGYHGVCSQRRQSVSGKPPDSRRQMSCADAKL